jgi:hypothetical protein
MPFLTPCPNCGARLKSASRLPAGQRLTCPKCHDKFITLAESEPFDPTKNRKRRDELPDAVLIDDEPDDRPPVRRKGQADRPRGRRRDTEEAPPEPRRPKGPLPPAVLAGLIVGGFVVCLAFGVLGYAVFREAQKPAAADLLAYAPADAVVLSGFDLDEVTGNEVLRKALERRAPPDLVELDRAGLRTADLSRALVARTANNGTACVVRFKAAPGRAKYLGPDVAGRGYAPFTSVGGSYRFGYFADRSTLVLADREPAILELWEKGAKARLPADLRDMVGRVHGPIWRATGRATPAEFPRSGAEEGLALWVGPAAGTAAWLEPEGRLGRTYLELAFDDPARAASAATAVRTTFHLWRGVNPFGDPNPRAWLDPADMADLRRGYDEATVIEGALRVSARVTLPAGEAVRVVGAVRY